MSKLKIKPVGDRILVRFAEEEQVRGRIIIPDNAKEKPQKATVIALGTGARTRDGAVIAFEVKIGDTVLVGKFAGTEVKFEDRKFTIIREGDILGLIA